MIPLILIFLVLLMVPLRLSAMESFFEEKKNERNNSTSAAAPRGHEREASERDEDNEEIFTSSAVDPSASSGGMNGIARTPSGESFAPLGTFFHENPTEPLASLGGHSTLAVVTDAHRQQTQISRASGSGASL
ncbi:MAG: hypothetical protein NT164_00570 [Verrucomicrobiae bacterium]|nr:hypothetical protein [Verrucomicrobiae bacterium]